MDEKSVRQQLAEVKAELAKLDAEREILLSLKRGFEGWLQLHDKKVENTQQLEFPAATPWAGTPTNTEETPSARRAVLRVLQAAEGAPMHVRDILPRVKSIGAKINEKNPEGWIDLLAYSLRKTHPIEKTGPRTWRWCGTAFLYDDAKDGEKNSHSESTE